MQALAFAGGLVQRFPWIRDRMIFDDKYLFKVLAECVIDCGECLFTDLYPRTQALSRAHPVCIVSTILLLLLPADLLSSPACFSGVKTHCSFRSAWLCLPFVS